MNKNKKKIWVAAFLVLGVVVLLGGVLLYADQLIVLGVETAGGEALECPTTLEKADLAILGGSISLHGLQIGNPEGFETQNLLSIGQCSGAVDLQSLLTDTVKIKHISIKGLALTIEQKGLTSNLQTVLDKIAESQKETDKPEKKSEESPEKSAGKKLLVEKIEIIEASVKVKLLPIPGQADAVNIKLAPIIIENISDDSNKAVLAGEIFQKVLLAVAKATVQSGIDLPAELLDNLQKSTKQLGEAMGKTADDILKGTETVIKEGGKIIEDGGKIIEQTGKGIGDALKLPGILTKPKPSDKSAKENGTSTEQKEK